MRKLSLIVLAVGAAVAAQSQVLVAWTFDNYTANTSTSQVGVIGTTPEIVATGVGGTLFTTNAEGGLNTNAAGTATGSVGGFGGTTINDPRAVPQASGALTIVGAVGGTGTSPTNNGANYTFQVTPVSGSVLNLSSLSFAFRGTGTGFANNQVSYSTDGVNFTNIGPTFAGNSTTFASTSIDLSTTSALQNASNVYLRFTFNGATGAAGNTRLDNLVLNGTVAPVPEPASMAALGIGALALLRRRKAARR